MKVSEHPLSPPDLHELASVLEGALQSNFASASVSVETCPDLSRAPFYLAAPGLSGSECIADVGGQPNLFPKPVLSAKYSLLNLAEHMRMSPDRGSLIGAGAGPFHVLGVNSELAPNLSWSGGFENVNNQTRYAKVDEKSSTEKNVICTKSPSTDCALMINLFGSSGLPGPVLKITARSRTGEQNLTDCIRFALHDKYGDGRPISLGGAFLIKKGKANFHVMPDFPSKNELPFKDRHQLNDWLTYHDFDAPIVCLTVVHSADPEKIGLRMEHTHCFASDGGNRGGHYHYDVKGDGVEEVEYEAYLNTAKMIYRIDKPGVTLERDLHD